MALARCWIVGVTRPSVIWGRNLCHESDTAHTDTGKHYRLLAAEMVDRQYAHISIRGRPASSSHHHHGKHAPPLLGLSGKHAYRLTGLTYKRAGKPPSCQVLRVVGIFITVKSSTALSSCLSLLLCIASINKQLLSIPTNRSCDSERREI